MVHDTVVQASLTVPTWARSVWAGNEGQFGAHIQNKGVMLFFYPTISGRQNNNWLYTASRKKQIEASERLDDARHDTSCIVTTTLTETT